MIDRSGRRSTIQIPEDRWLIRVGALIVAVALGALPASPLYAQPTPTPAPVDSPSKRVCVDAEVNGEVALSYDCLSRQLAPTPTAAADGSADNVAEGLAKGPSNKVGTFNYSAESIRFGSNWGKSVEPQRPAPAPVVPPR